MYDSNSYEDWNRVQVKQMCNNSLEWTLVFMKMYGVDAWACNFSARIAGRYLTVRIMWASGIAYDNKLDGLFGGIVLHSTRL